MKQLTLVVDGQSARLTAVRRWAERHATHLRVEWLAADEAPARLPGLEPHRLGGGGLVAVADDGRFWTGDGAWGLLLWALRRTRAEARAATAAGRAEVRLCERVLAEGGGTAAALALAGRVER